MRCSSEMGGTPDDHQKWGVYTSAAENGGDPCAAEGRAKKGTPSGCFLHLPLIIWWRGRGCLEKDEKNEGESVYH